MGLLDNLFSLKENIQDTKSTDNIKLVNAVQKIDKAEGGVFVNIYNDLGTYIENAGIHENDLRKMAYAYARRAAAAGLCAQGIWGEQEYSYSLTLFQSMQQLTGQSIAFQEEAYVQAIELIQSYDSRLNKELISGIVSMIGNDASLAQKNGMFFSVDELLNMFNKN